MPPNSLGEELKKIRGFRSPKQEAIINLMRTHDRVQLQLMRLFREHDLTVPQYNVLRILRGEGRALTCSEIAERTIAVVPGITRVVDRLIKAELVKRCQCRKDRRVWWISISSPGRQKLKRLDHPLALLEDELLSTLSDREASQLNLLLDKVREPLE